MSLNMYNVQAATQHQLTLTKAFFPHVSRSERTNESSVSASASASAMEASCGAFASFALGFRCWPSAFGAAFVGELSAR